MSRSYGYALTSSFAMTLSMAAALSLQACGGNPPPPVVVNPTVTPPPAPPAYTPPTSTSQCTNTTTVQQSPFFGYYQNIDYVASYMLPQLQCYYGNITLQNAVTINGVTVPAGQSISWADLYSTYVLRMAQGCGCTVQSPANNMSIWAVMNYTSLYGSLGMNANYGTAPTGWVDTMVTTQSGMQVYFSMILNLLVSSNYTYYSTYYTYPAGYYAPVYNPGYNYYAPRYGNSVGGFLSYSNGNGLSFDLGGVFNWH